MSTDKIICRCEEVTEKEIKAVIAAGAETIDEVKKWTRAGMGLCQGNTCRRLVSEMIHKATGRIMSEITPATFRPPVRPIKIEYLIDKK